VTLFGILFFSFFTSYLTNALVQANFQQTNNSKQLWLLRRYLRQYHIYGALNYRVLRYAEFQCKKTKELLTESQVLILEQLSEQLRFELQFTIYFEKSVVHPLFAHLVSVSDVTVHTLAWNAFMNKSLAYGDMAFKRSHWETSMYIIASGELDYQKDETYNRNPKEGDWMCEAALWVQWRTRGSCMALSDCQIIAIDVNALATEVMEDDWLWAFVSHYALNFEEWINDQELDELVDVNIKWKILADTFVTQNADENREDRMKRLRKKRQKLKD
jgi:hypothetical protein